MRFTRIVALALAISTLSSSISFAATWNQENGIWYCDTKGWVECSDGWYYTNHEGKMVTNDVVDGYYLSITGRMINPDNDYEKLINALSVNTGLTVCDVNVEGIHKALHARGFKTPVQYTTYKDGSIEYGLSVESQKAFKDQLSTINEWVSKTDGRFSSLPVRERIRAIHDFVRETFTYGESGSLHESLQTGKAVCWEYASLFHILCERNGIDCEYVEGQANNTIEIVPHAWNRVRVGGKAYLVDCCWNDTANTDKYFMIESSTGHYELGGTYA